MALQTKIDAAPDDASKDERARTAFTLPTMQRKVSADDRMFFTEQLALLLETGESLYAALTTIARQTVNERMREVVDQVAQDVSEGRSFGSALAEHPQVFSTTYVNLITASEGGGFMYEVLQQLLHMDRKRQELRATLVSAASYPAFLILFSLAVVVFVLVVVFPKFGAMFNSIYDQLPATTKVLMTFSDVLRAHWAFIVGGLVAAAVLLRRWAASAAGTRHLDHLKLRAPLLRDVYTQVYLVQSFQVLGLSLVNGVSVMDSLQACRDVVRNSLFRGLLSDVAEKVESGAGVAAGFDASPLVPDLAKHLVATGEQTGQLGMVMGRVAEYYEAQLTKRLATLSKLAEPVMLLVMGVIVGVLVSSLILPIFKLSRAVS